MDYEIRLYLKQGAIGQMSRVFPNGPGDRGSIPGRVIPKTQKMVLDVSLLNTQYYKVRIKGKVEQSRETLIYMYKKGLAFDDLQWLICRITKTNRLTNFISVGRSYGIRRLHLCRRVRLPAIKEFPGYDRKPSDGESPIQEL